MNSSVATRAASFATRNGTWLAVFVLVLTFSLLSERFLTVRNAETIATQIAELGVVALPLGLLVVAGSLDLSVGSIISLAAVCGGLLMESSNSVIAGVAVALGVGLVAGAINGWLTSYLRINPIVVTLGFLSVWGGLALAITDGATVVNLPDSFVDLGTLDIAGVPVQVFILCLGVAVAWWILARRPFGRALYAIGGNERAAHLMGVEVKRVRFIVFLYVGVSAGFAGLMLSAKLASAPPTVGSGYELQALTTVLLGGVAFAGGRGRVSGMVAGLLFVGVLTNGLVVIGTSQFLQQILLGATLVVAVSLDDGMRSLIRSSWQDGGDREQRRDEPRRDEPDAPTPAGTAHQVST